LVKSSSLNTAEYYPWIYHGFLLANHSMMPLLLLTLVVLDLHIRKVNKVFPLLLAFYFFGKGAINSRSKCEWFSERGFCIVKYPYMYGDITQGSQPFDISISRSRDLLPTSDSRLPLISTLLSHKSIKSLRALRLEPSYSPCAYRCKSFRVDS